VELSGQVFFSGPFIMRAKGQVSPLQREPGSQLGVTTPGRIPGSAAWQDLVLFDLNILL
jgi:hypothetical protein